MIPFILYYFRRYMRGSVNVFSTITFAFSFSTTQLSPTKPFFLSLILQCPLHLFPNHSATRLRSFPSSASTLLHVLLLHLPILLDPQVVRRPIAGFSIWPSPRPNRFSLTRSPGSDNKLTLIVSKMNSLHSDDSVKTVGLDSVENLTVGNIFEYLRSSNHIQYQFSTGGQGCRYLTRFLDCCGQRDTVRMSRRLKRQELRYRSLGMDMARRELRSRPV